MDGIKLSVVKFEKFIANTDDHIWFGILKREYWNKKYTVSEWKALINNLKNRPSK